MLNKLLSFLRKYDLITPGEQVTCAFSGGADSVALLFALYLLKEKLDIQLSAAHFNHRLRGDESDRDEAFVREFCGRYDIPLLVGSGDIIPGKKGLEAAARDARYAFLRSIPGKIATAHTADDNAETVLMHMTRGTGLKGLGGIAPVNGRIIRPMLGITRREVEDFCSEWCLNFVQDSSNAGDDFLRNRLRHHVMPLLTRENPVLAQQVSAMALRLRQDEDCLQQMLEDVPVSVEWLKQTHPALRSRVLERFLKDSGIREPEASHIARLEALVFSEKPSARADFPGGVTIARNYDALEVLPPEADRATPELTCPGEVLWNGYRIVCRPADTLENGTASFTVCPRGAMVIRAREAGDTIRLSGGTKSLKKLFIDRKIPAARRSRIPVIADEQGVLAVYGIGANLNRLASQLPAVHIAIEEKSERNITEER